MKKNKIKYINSYINEISNKILENENQKEKIFEIFSILKKLNKNNTVHVFGNGGSSSIASHFSMDLTNNSSLKCINHSDPSMITCYSNDFGYENWMKRALEKFGKKGDLLFLISSSGESQNIINSLKIAKKLKFKKIIGFSGFYKNNRLSKQADISFWINSKNYNMIENIHQIYLLLLVDLFKDINK